MKKKKTYTPLEIVEKIVIASQFPQEEMKKTLKLLEQKHQNLFYEAMDLFLKWAKQILKYQEQKLSLQTQTGDSDTEHILL